MGLFDLLTVPKVSYADLFAPGGPLYYYGSLAKKLSPTT